MSDEVWTEREYAFLIIEGHGPLPKITEALDIDPDTGWSEGDAWPSKSDPDRVRKRTNWRLNSGLNDTYPLNQHVREVMARLSGKRNAVLRLGAQYDVRIVFVMQSTWRSRFELDFALQRDLTDFGIRLWFDAIQDVSVHDLVTGLQNRLAAAGLDAELPGEDETAPLVPYRKPHGDSR